MRSVRSASADHLSPPPDHDELVGLLNLLNQALEG